MPHYHAAIFKRYHIITFEILNHIKVRFLNNIFSLQSVILLSRLPFINLYYEVLALIAPKYFDGGEHILNSVCQDISNWPSLQAGECIQLSLLDSIFQTYIPSLTSANLQQPSSMLTNQRTEPKYDSTENLSTSSPNDLKSLEFTPVKVDNFMKIDNSNQLEQSQASKSNVVQSREDILDSYKQSKELLLAQNVKLKSDPPCDSSVNSIKAIGANNLNDNYDVEDIDSDEESEENSINILNNR